MIKKTKSIEIAENKNIRVVAPAGSLKLISENTKKIAINSLEEAGMQISYGKHVYEIDGFDSSSIKSRISDLHKAFEDKNVDIILSVIGGYNSNQLLKYIDYNLIKKNPKIICGYSDMTALLNAITVKTGLTTFLGPHYSSWGMKTGFGYSKKYFLEIFNPNKSFEILPSDNWSDDAWYLDQKNRNFIPNRGFWVLNSGKGEGIIYGGNLSTFNLLQGTEYFPKLKGSILIVEVTDAVSPGLFDSCLQSLVLQKDFNGVKGMLIGRFQKGSNMTKEKLNKIIKTKKELNNIPIIANVDFGHTTPIATLPIGGIIKIEATKKRAIIQVIKF